MRQWLNHSGALSNILYGIISLILSALIIALLKLLRDSLPFSLLCIAFCFVVAFFFVLIKFIATRKELITTLANHAEFSQEIQASISVIIGLKKSNIRLQTYCSLSVLRLIFVDGELFLTPFRKGTFLSSAPTFKVLANGALFKCYEALFSEIWDNQSKEAVAQ